MSRDPIDELGERLFEVARREPPPAGAEQRLLEAARHRHEAPRSVSPRGVRFRALMLPALVAAAAAAFLMVKREQPLGGISAEPPSATRDSRPTTPGPNVEPTAAVAPVLPPQGSSSAAQQLAPRSSAPSAPAATLADELAALQQAKQALAGGDTRTALQALDRYDHVLKGQQLRAEASLLRMDTLSRAGQREAAAELAARFVAQNPGSPLVDRARSFIVPAPSPSGATP